MLELAGFESFDKLKKFICRNIRVPLQRAGQGGIESVLFYYTTPISLATLSALRTAMGKERRGCGEKRNASFASFPSRYLIPPDA